MKCKWTCIFMKWLSCPLWAFQLADTEIFHAMNRWFCLVSSIFSCLLTWKPVGILYLSSLSSEAKDLFSANGLEACANKMCLNGWNEVKDPINSSDCNLGFMNSFPKAWRALTPPPQTLLPPITTACDGHRNKKRAQIYNTVPKYFKTYRNACFKSFWTFLEIFTEKYLFLF
jgi:hypothetical protein